MNQEKGANNVQSIVLALQTLSELCKRVSKKL